MDTSARADVPAVLHDALKQRYFLPHVDEKTASDAKRADLYTTEGDHGFAHVTSLGEATSLDTSSTSANTEVSVANLQRERRSMLSADPVIVASSMADKAKSATIPPSEPTKTTSGLPSRAMVDRAADLTVDDAQGRVVPFRDLYRAEPGQKRRVMIIFIRHFFCGNCQEFVRTLVSQIPPKSLPVDTSIALIGCGSHTLIPSYTQLTACPYPIYADPTKRLFDTLGMQRSLSLGWNSPNYIHNTLAAGWLKSIVQGVKRIPAGDVTKAGGLSQNGGEFVFEVEAADTRSKKHEAGQGATGSAALKVTVSFCHRMRNTRDHTEMPQLIKLLDSSEADERSHRRRMMLERRWTSGGAIENLARSLSNKRQSWLDRRNSNSWSRTRRRERSESSTRGDMGRRRSPDGFETVREDVKSRDGQRSKEETAKTDTATPTTIQEVEADAQRFCFEKEKATEG